MTVQIKNSQRDELLYAKYQARHDPVFAWSRALSSQLLLPGLRGTWGLGSVDENGAAYDHSGQGRTLTNNSSLQYGVYNSLVPYAIHDASADYLSRTDEAALDITGNLTLGCWVYSNNAPGGNERVIGKFNTTGNQRAYSIRYSTTTLSFVVSSNGTATTSVDTTVTYAAGVWWHVVGRYTPSTELSFWVNGVETVNTTSIPASLFNSSSDFCVGASGAGSEVLDGWTALPFLCAAALTDGQILALYHTQRALFSQ